MTKQQLSIYFLVGIMVFSAIGTGILLLSQGDSSPATQAELQRAVEEQTTLNNAEENVDRFLPVGTVTTLTTDDLVVGTGDAVVASDNVTVHYTGWLATDGTVFDSSVGGDPASFPLSGVIQGWQEGIPGMQVGGKRRLVIPADLAYGSGGTPDGSIPPNTALVFEVELISIQ